MLTERLDRALGPIHRAACPPGLSSASGAVTVSGYARRIQMKAEKIADPQT